MREEKMCRKHCAGLKDSGNRHLDCNIGLIYVCESGCAICDWCDKKAKQPLVMDNE